MEPAARRWFEERDKWKYDLLGNVHFVFFIIRGERHKVTCSAGVAGALGFADGYRFDPGTLFVVLSNPVFALGGPDSLTLQLSQP